MAAAQFRPNQAVAHGEDGAQNPSQHSFAAPPHCAHISGMVIETGPTPSMSIIERGRAAPVRRRDQLRRIRDGACGAGSSP